MAKMVQQLQGLPQLTSTDPLCWLGLEPWTPQWTQHCSWAQPPHPSLPQPSSSSVDRPGETKGGKCGDESTALHAGQNPQQDGAKEPGPSSTPAVSGNRDAACPGCTMAHPSGSDDLVCSVEEQCGDVKKVSLPYAQATPAALPLYACSVCCCVLHVSACMKCIESDVYKPCFRLTGLMQLVIESRCEQSTDDCSLAAECMLTSLPLTLVV